MTRPWDRPLARRAAAVVWAGVLFWLSSRPVLPGPEVRYLDKAEHAAAYAILAWLCARAFATFRAFARRTRPERWALVVLACALYGVSDEAHQAFVPGRSCDPWDAAADTTGALLVALAGRKIAP